MLVVSGIILLSNGIFLIYIIYSFKIPFLPGIGISSQEIRIPVELVPFAVMLVGGRDGTK